MANLKRIIFSKKQTIMMFANWKQIGQYCNDLLLCAVTLQILVISSKS